MSRENILRIVFYAVVGAFLGGLLLIADTRMNRLSFLVLVAAAGIITVLGEILLHLFQVRRLASWLPAAFVAGTAVTSIAMTIPVLLAHWSAQSAFLAWGGVVIVMAAVLWRRLNPASIRSFDLGAALIFAILAGYFSRHQAAAVPILSQTDVLPAWLDYFAHGTIIASLGDPLAIDAGDIMLPGTPRIFYHYGPFMLPAALSQLTGLSGLALATAIMLPLGLFVGICGLFALAAELAGIVPALLAVWFVACLPDASHYLLSNGFFGFQWLLYTAPGSGYAIGLAAIAYACLVQWFRDRRRGALALAILLTFMLILIRVHMFMLLAPALLGAAVLDFLPAQWKTRVVIAGCAGASVLTVFLVAGAFGRFGSEIAKPSEYILIAYSTGPVFYAQALRHLAELAGTPVATIAGILLLLPATLGLWVIIFPLVAFLEVKAGRFQPEDYLPPLLCGTYLLLMFWAPAAFTGDLTEYKHRHFVLLYAVVVMWTIIRLIRLLDASKWLKARKSFMGCQPARVTAFLIASIITTALVYRQADAAQPSKNIFWAETFYPAHIEPGISQAAAFIRDHSHPGDIIAVGGRGAHGALSGPDVELSSMTDLPVYVGRIDLLMAARSPEIVEIVRTRAEQIVEIDKSADHARAFKLLRAHGIRWYVTVAPELPAWDQTGDEAAFKAGSTYVYDAKREDEKQT